MIEHLDARSTVQATSIGIGVPVDREHVGTGYVSFNFREKEGTRNISKPIVHRNLRCKRPRDNHTLEEVPLFIEDDNLKVYYDQHVQIVDWCEKCPPDLEWEWQERAACKGSDLDFIDPPLKGRGELLAVCEGCPVVVECFKFAISDRDNSGVWGGVWLQEGMQGRKRTIEKRKKELGLDK